MEKEKGQSSDAFKRAGVKWGIGRFLYAMEVKKVNSNKKDDGQKPKPYVVNAQGKREYNITEYINGLNGKNVPKTKDTPQKPKAPPKPHKNVPSLSVQTATLAHTAGMEKPAYLALLSRVSGIAEDKIEQSVKSITKAHWDEIQKIIQAKIELDKGAKK